MYPRAFEYCSPETVSEAVELLSRHGEEAKLIAGGQSLVPLMKLRLASPGYLIDLNRIPGLSYIEEEEGRLLLGSLTRHAEVESSRLVQEKLPILHDAASVIGDVQIRNRGTIGGSLAHADPSADLPVALLALGGRVRTAGRSGERSLLVDELIVDTYTTDLAPDEVITGVEIPVPEGAAGGAYVKFEKRAGDFAVAGVGVQLRLGDGEQLEEIAIALGAVGPTVLRASGAEALLRGQAAAQKRLVEAAEKVSEECEPLVDNRGSVAYKRHLAGVVFRTAFKTALARAQGRESVPTVHL